MRNIERIAIEGNAEIVISKISPDIIPIGDGFGFLLFLSNIVV